MPEVDEAIHTPFPSFSEIPHFQTIRQIEVLFLPTVADPADIAHVSSFELVILVRPDAVDSADHSLYYWKRVFAVLLLGLDEEPFVVYKAGIALEMQAEESVVAAKGLSECGY